MQLIAPTPSPLDTRPPTSKGEILAEMYRPPIEITFQGTFDQAKAEAERRDRLLLVNLQAPSEFACQRLNRDTWRDEKVRQLVQQSFVFWQQEEVRTLFLS